MSASLHYDESALRSRVHKHTEGKKEIHESNLTSDKLAPSSPTISPTSGPKRSLRSKNKGWAISAATAGSLSPSKSAQDISIIFFSRTLGFAVNSSGALPVPVNKTAFARRGRLKQQVQVWI